MENVYPKITFKNPPSNAWKFRSDSCSIIKGEDDKLASINVKDLGELRCTLLIKLLLKDPADKNHFHHLCQMSDKSNRVQIEYELVPRRTQIELNFFGIKKAPKKEAMTYLNEHFQNNVGSTYTNNASTAILQITLINSVSKKQYDTLSFEFGNKEDQLVVLAYSPKTLLHDNELMELTFVLETPEKDSESIDLEIITKNGIKKIRPMPFNKPLSRKTVFVFSLKHDDIHLPEFSARVCRKGSIKVHSDWKMFTIINSGIENGKRKTNHDYDEEPQSKIPRSVLPCISENAISDINITDYIASPTSTFSYIASSSKQFLNDHFSNRVLSSIARVGHDFAFGRDITDQMINVSKQLPVVYILQDDVGDSPLHNAILKNQENRAIQILDIVSQKFPDDLFTKNTSNHTALILSPACGVSVDFVRRLIMHGFNISDKDCDGNNALTIAIEYKNAEVLETLANYAVNKESFNNQYSEVFSLIRKTLETYYFEGYQIIMNSGLGLHGFCDDSNLDSRCMAILREFNSRLQLDETPLPELNTDCLKMLLDCDLEELLADE